MTELTKHIRDLELILTGEQRKRLNRLREEVSSIYESGRLTDMQKLYLIERVSIDRPVDVRECLKLNLTNAAKLYLNPPPKKASRFT